MRTVSSYGVEIRKQNIPVRQTMEIYRQAVSYLTEIYAQVWEELREIPETKKRFNTAEHMVHMTKKNTARFDFDLRFPKMPSYLRRSAIQHALGSVSSYETRLGQWKETGVLSGRPKLTCRNHAMPVFYRDVMYREGAEGKDEAYLKLVDKSSTVNYMPQENEIPADRPHSQDNQEKIKRPNIGQVAPEPELKQPGQPSGRLQTETQVKRPSMQNYTGNKDGSAMKTGVRGRHTEKTPLKASRIHSDGFKIKK